MAKKLSQEKIQQYAPMLIAYIKRHGGCAPLDDTIKAYTDEVVQYCIKQGTLHKTRIKAKHTHNAVPPRTFDAIFMTDWDRERPLWLDSYLQG